MCISRGLLFGGTKPERIQRLIESMKKDGEMDKIREEVTREQRRDELAAMSTEALQTLCTQKGLESIQLATSPTL